MFAESIDLFYIVTQFVRRKYCIYIVAQHVKSTENKRIVVQLVR